MSYELQASAPATQLGNSLTILTLLIQIIGLVCFAYIVYKRVSPMLHAQRDFRLNRPGLRVQSFACRSQNDVRWNGTRKRSRAGSGRSGRA